MNKNNKIPNPNEINPIPNVKNLEYIKPTIKNKNIIVGEFTYFADNNFEKNITHFYDFINDKLIIGKFCQIGKNVNFVMNGANHKMNCVSTYPFYIFNTWNQDIPNISELPIKGDTIIGNDVWIGENVTILPGVHIGDGAIIGMNSVVGKNIESYTINVGNPVKTIKKRFDDELITLLLKLKWWNKTLNEINSLIPILTSNNLEYVKDEIHNLLIKTKCHNSSVGRATDS